MSMLLTIALALPQSIAGLRAGESYVELAPSPATRVVRVVADGDAVLDAIVRGRIIDASTARPVVNARIETWTEEIDATYGGMHRIGETRSRRDGRFEVLRREGAEIAEKVRITADGYLAWSGTMGDLYSPVPLFRAHEAIPAPTFRVVDSSGRPIAGARFTSTYSCAHDVPAFDLTTGVDGVAQLVECGVQDHDLELRVRAPGFQAIKYLDWFDELARAADASTIDLALPRCEPFALRVLRADGSVAPHLPLYVLDGDSYHVLRTDDEGIARILSRYGHGPVVVHELVDPQNRFLAEISPPPDGRITNVRVAAEDWPASLDTGMVRVDWLHRAADTPQLDVQFAHEDGWITSRRFDAQNPAVQVRMPIGQVTVTLGGAFRGAAAIVRDVEVRADVLTEVGFEVELEPTLRLLVPDDRFFGAWIEAGTASHIDFRLDDAICVPRGLPLTIGLREMGGRLHIQHVAPLTADTVLDLQERLGGARVRTTEPTIVEQRVKFVAAPAGPPVEGLQVSLRSVDPDAEVRLADDGENHVFHGAVGTPWMVRSSAPGHVATWHRGVFGGPPVECVQPKFAKLRLAADFEFRLVDGEDSAIDLEELTPGPLQLCIERADGRRFGLSLIVAPGEERTVTLPG